VKTLLTITTILSILTATNAMARRGEPDALNGTAAWFTTESAEHEVRGLLGANKLNENETTAIEVILDSETTSTVRLTTTNSEISDACKMENHSSRGGSILKKEVYCNNAPYNSPEARPSRGSNAWAITEGMEHSMRLAVAQNAQIVNDVSGAYSALDGSEFVKVYINLKSSADSLDYICKRTSSSNRADMNCQLAQ
jgi:hypothetical protein